MKVNKLGHACLIISDQNRKLIIDPGEFSDLPTDLSGIGAIVITEEHTDHASVDNVSAILKQSPKTKIFTTTSVSRTLAEHKIDSRAIEEAADIDAAGFRLTFQAGEHAPVYQKSPCQVITIQVDDFLYYAADSYIPTPNEVLIHALPTSGPWFKIEETIDYAKSVKSKILLATHNGLNSEIGNSVANHFFETNLGKDRQWLYLKPGESKRF